MFYHTYIIPATIWQLHVHNKGCALIMKLLLHVLSYVNNTIASNEQFAELAGHIVADSALTRSRSVNMYVCF